jgi:hypothetical protein
MRHSKTRSIGSGTVALEARGLGPDGRLDRDDLAATEGVAARPAGLGAEGCGSQPVQASDDGAFESATEAPCRVGRWTDALPA